MAWPAWYTTIITSSSILGLMLGSLLCDGFLGRLGRIKTAYFANFLVILSVVPQMWLHVASLIIGRFMLGFGGGLCIVSSSVFMAETVPSWKLGTIGTAVNSGIIFALLVTALIQGFTLPDTTMMSDLWFTTTNWRYGFLAPGILAFINVLMWKILVSFDSLFYLIDNNREDEGFSHFKKIYEFKDNFQCIREWEITKKQRANFMKSRSTEPTLKDIFSDSRYKTCTFFLILAAIINQMSGINAINIYSNTILAGIPGMSVTMGVYLLATANVVGALIGPLVQVCFRIRTMLIVGQFVMGTFLGGVCLFSYLMMPQLVLVCMIGMIVTYQCNLGSYFFVYVSQVATETQNSVAVFSLWATVLALSFLTGLMINGLGIFLTFIIFMVITFAGGIFFILMMKDTEGLTSSECK